MPVSLLMLHIKRTQRPAMRVLCQNNFLYIKRLLRQLHVFRALPSKFILLLKRVSPFSVRVSNILYALKTSKWKHDSILSHAFNNSSTKFLCLFPENNQISQIYTLLLSQSLLYQIHCKQSACFRLGCSQSLSNTLMSLLIRRESSLTVKLRHVPRP